jgi:hypothetical protein
MSWLTAIRDSGGRDPPGHHGPDGACGGPRSAGRRPRTRSRTEGDGRSDTNRRWSMKADLDTIGPEATLKARRCRRTDARNATVGSGDEAPSSTVVEANRPLKAVQWRPDSSSHGRGGEHLGGSRNPGILLGRQRTDSGGRLTRALSAQKTHPTARSCVVFDSTVSPAGLAAQRTNGSSVTAHGRWSSRDACLPGGPRPPLGAPADQPPGTYPLRRDRRAAGSRAQGSRALIRVGGAEGRTWPG